MTTADFFNFSILQEPSFWLGTIVFAIIAYTIGSINAGQLLSSFGKKNLGEAGSKSFGATNAGRVYGKWAFVAVFLFDLAKAIFVVLILMAIRSSDSWAFEYADITIAALFVVIGHIFPIYFSFKGGKGVASAFGLIIVLNWIFALIAITVFIIVKLINGWTSIASIFGVATGVILTISCHWLFINDPLNKMVFNWSLIWTTIFSALILGILIISKHVPNIMRMVKGEEPWSKKKIKEKNNDEK